MKDRILEIITTEGQPISHRDLVSKSGLPQEQVYEIVHQLIDQRMVYPIGSGEGSENPFYYSLMDRRLYWKEPFKSDIDRQIYVYLLENQEKNHHEIAHALRIPEVQILHSVNRLLDQLRVSTLIRNGGLCYFSVPGTTPEEDHE